jgi:DNA primase
MAEVLNAALPLSEVMWRQLLGEHPTDTPERRAALDRAAQAKAESISDPAVRFHYVAQFRNRLRELFAPPMRRPGGRDRPAWGRAKGRSPVPVNYSAPPRPADPAAAPRLRERILLATLLNHPDLFDRVEERLGALSFSDPRLDLLRQTTLIEAAQRPDLDFSALEAHLQSLGFAAEIATLLHPEVYVHAGFARPGVSIEQATVGWDHTFALCQQASLEADLERAERELAENPTEQTFAVFKALREQARPSGGSEGDEDGEAREHD